MGVGVSNDVLKVSSVLIILISLASIVTFIGLMRNKKNAYGEFVDNNIQLLNSSSHPENPLISK